MTNTREIIPKEHEEISSWNQEWIKLLCSYGSKIEYEQVTKGCENAMFAIMKYRKLLKFRGMGNISFITLNTAYTLNDYTKLHNLLQELFLENIGNEQFNYIINKINKTEDGLHKLYTQHKQNTNKRISTIIITL
mgnify:FL=1